MPAARIVPETPNPTVSERGARSAARPEVGLVHSQTSETRTGAECFLDPRIARQKRCKTSIITAARLIEQRKQRCYPVMITLTFADVAAWRARCITEFLWAVRSYLRRLGHPLIGVWKFEVGELNGRIHYHVLLWLPVGITLPKPDKRGWWRYGMTQIARARNSVGYIAKYASKPTDFELLPEGARLFALLGLDEEQRAERSWWQCPRFVRSVMAIADRPRRARGGGWVSLLTGEVLRSAWRFQGMVNRGGVSFCKLVEVAPCG